MDDDQDIFDQLDRLQSGAHVLDASYEPRRANSTAFAAYDGHDSGYHTQAPYANSYAVATDDYEDAPLQLDAFDQRLLRQPDRDSRQWQASQGHARLSLPPAATQPSRVSQFDHSFHDPRPAASQRPDLSRFAFSPSQNGVGDISPDRSARLSSPAFSASQRHPPPLNNDHSEYQQRHQPQIRGHSFARNQPEASNALQVHRTHDDEQSSDQDQFPQQPSITTSQAAQSQSLAPARTSQAPTPIVQGIPLVPVRQLSDKFRTVFTFPLFNAVQSKCFPVVFQSNDNFVLSSPTGSGKTVIFELAICRLVQGHSSGSFKIVYMAPTKSLCSERARDWHSKFGAFDLQCAELTGDTDNAQLRNVQHASIIITTPEKWDSVTRKWKDHQKLMHMVKLFLVDEVHMLKEDRGPTLEAVVSRMKSVGSDVRFIALSATVPNSQDIATWLGKDSLNPQIPAPREKFGEEFRPVRLQKHVCGYKSDSNDFAFEKLLDSKLTDVIVKWSQRKPIMVFCMTRKSCVTTAQLLAKWWSSKGPRDRYWTAPRSRIVVADKDLKETTASGVAFHHAGVSNEDRAAVEQGYLSGELSVICCTSTLAVGVNLPCHMVIIKGTVCYQTSGSKEYSDLETMQMLGRAGRPQFDDSAVAVIMTRLHRVETYEKMMTGSEVLESCLHQHLIDHFNAEIGLCTINNAYSAKKWLTGTFLYVRLKENPEHYQLEGLAQGRTLDERLEHICTKAIDLLQEHDLVHGTIKLECTEFGDSMARYYIQFDTMKQFLALRPRAKISEILSTVSQAAEFKDIRFRAGEKPIYKELNKNQSMKFPIPVNIDLTAHKVSLIIQSVLGAIDVNTEDQRHRYEYNTSRLVIFQQAHRLIRCIIDCQLYLEDAVSARNALMLARSLSAQVWDDSPLHIKQIEGIGPVGVRKLVAAGLKSIEDVANAESGRIENAMTRNPPFGSELKKKAMAFPQLRISMKIVGEPIVKKGEGVTIKVNAEIGFINEKVPETFNRKPVYICLLAEASDCRKVHFARISAKKMGKGQEILFSAILKTQAQVIRGYLMCDEIAGTQRMAMLKPDLPGFMFPVAKPDQESQLPTNQENAPNTSKRRAAAATEARPNNTLDEFGDASLDDAALAAADFTNIDDFDDDGNEKNKAKEKPQKRKVSTEPRESVQLPNGKWTCNHACKDKTACKHGACCREGLDKKPRPPKPKDTRKNEPASDPRQTQLDLSKTKKQSASTGSQQPSARKPLQSKEARDLEQLHNSVNTSTKAIPLLSKAGKGKGEASRKEKSTKHDENDYDLGALASDDFPADPFTLQPETAASQNGGLANADLCGPDDDMLDMPEDVVTDPFDNIEAGNDNLLDLSQFPDPLDFDPGNDWNSGLSNSDGFPQNHTLSRFYSIGGEQSEENLNRPFSMKEKGMFVTGDSTDSINDNSLAFVSGALQEDHREVHTPAYTRQPKVPSKRPFADTAPTDASEFISSSKHQKAPSRRPSGLELESSHWKPAQVGQNRQFIEDKALSIEDNTFLAEIAGISSVDPPAANDAQTDKSKDDIKATAPEEETMEQWFEKNFGLEKFELI
ncbi:hypothetical protein CKM354_000872000 [Cercospora kikuchii]|uniref:DNA 3'-5' helicase n=1 Tax=Cercospora kikuchii TaxID=84275 RepID=A0A9P3CMK0_9PEZI|nr:uncharacterized protein CKM354_000872000 [Cercospora kikuchii]GIZ45559.1 hypothetical protein CKM354_000872000 [Cercospora kikuchii]